MGMTICEKIFAMASNKPTVRPGEIITVKVDMCMSNDATTHISVDMYENELKNKRIYNNDSVVFIVDHNIPAENAKTAEAHNKMRRFAKNNKIKYHEGEGVCHQIMIERYLKPGDVIIAADSHACSYGALGAFGIGVGSTDFVYAMVTGTMWIMVPETIKFNLTGKLRDGVYARDLILKIIGDIGASGANYKVMEFAGDSINRFTIDDRIVLCNMAVESGAKSGIIEPDQLALDYIKDNRTDYIGGIYLSSDTDASYSKVYNYNLNEIEPMIAKPHNVDNVSIVSECEGIKINQAFIGSCNNGRIEELREAAKILKNSRVNSDVRLLISPASKKIYMQALEEGLLNIFSESGAMIMNPNCSVCWGSCQGVIGENEVLISTGTRNFKGRCGHPVSSVYLASAATVAYSAIKGVICDPRGVVYKS
jgi:3-isopropylmalate/(R)-2-methylmalate dehydratase large subunit